MQIDLIDSIKIKNTLGESVVWDERTGHIWWTDIPARMLYRYSLELKILENFTIAERACSIGLTDQPDILIIAFESGFGLFTVSTGRIKWLMRVEQVNAGRRFNDGRVDRQGRFWSGTMVEDDNKAPPSSARLYCHDHTAGLMVMENDIKISNGICWSIDSSIFYFADSPRQVIYAYDFDSCTAAITNRRVFATTDDTTYPDGGDVDARGYIWSAQWGGRRLVRYAPDGAIDHIHHVPVTQPTCLAFGGRNMNLLFMTTAREGLSPVQLEQEPEAGNLLIYRTNTTGLFAPKYRLE